MTIQPTTSSNPYAAAQHAASKPPAPSSPHQEPQDTVELSAQAKASVDADHDGDSH